MTLYRPGHAPEVAPPVPIVYQIAKSCGHSSMAIYQIVVRTWRIPRRIGCGAPRSRPT